MSARSRLSKWTPFHHVVVGTCFLLLFLLLNRPEVLVITSLGEVVWYPATSLAFTMFMALSPGYAPVAAFGIWLAGMLIYHQSPTTASGTLGGVGTSLFYAVAAYELKTKRKIDATLHRQRDVVLYLLISTMAAMAGTILGVACLALDGAIRWIDFGKAALMWFLGDECGLLSIAPFLLVHVFPFARISLRSKAILADKRRFTIDDMQPNPELAPVGVGRRLRTAGRHCGRHLGRVWPRIRAFTLPGLCADYLDRGAAGAAPSRIRLVRH